MLFHSLTFLVFLSILLPLYYLFSHRWQNYLLLGGSYLFYAAWDWRFLPLLVAQTAINYFAALGMSAAARPFWRRSWLILALGVNLGLLGAFKYYDFFAEGLAGLIGSFGLHAPITVLRLILPVGISFYTFQMIAYVVDVYRGRLSPTRNPVSFALYVAYFPHLVAGPIMRAGQLLPQIERPRVVTGSMISGASQLILLGFLKKVGIADAVAPLVEKAFADPAGCSSPALLLSMYLFAIQIYCDFSGYTDIARGVSRLFGIELMVNFRQPYLSRSVTEFWRRWHISLSTWLRDYLYIPMGGSRAGTWATYRNLCLTMLLGGLWHGASWTFVVWGALHGLYLSADRFFATGRSIASAPMPRDRRGWLRFAVEVTATFHLVGFSWIFFRAPDLKTALTYISGLFTNPLALGSAGRGLLVATVFYGALIFLIDLGSWLHGREFPLSGRIPAWARGVAYAAAILIISFVGGSRVIPFLYFQF